MSSQPSTPSLSQYDLVFAGGGAAACVTAGRLSKADPSLKILVLEAGLHTKDSLAHRQPARFIGHLHPSSSTVTFNVGTPTKETGNRAIIVPSGRCVGGGSSVNFAIYSRAAASDYDDWETVHGNAGWGSKDLVPLLKKTETYQVEADQPTHGYDGPLAVSYGGVYTNVGKEFLQVAAAYDPTRKLTNDTNSIYENDQYGRWPKWINGEDGTRSDAAHGYIYNQDNKNLEVIAGKRVIRVVFEGTRATGLEYTSDIVSDPESDQKVHFVGASKLVILAAGAFGSPTILERSGVGKKDFLEKLGVKSVVDLPGVGDNYQDHNAVIAPYLAGPEAETLDLLFMGNQDEIDKWAPLWPKGKGMLAHNGMDAGIKMRPNADDLKELGPEFASVWASYYANALDKPAMFFGPFAAYFGDPSLVTPRKYFCVGYFSQYPESVGYVHIKSTNPHTAPDFSPGFLTKESDISLLRWGYKKSREIARRMGLYRGAFKPAHPDFPEGSEAFGVEEKGPVDIANPNINYTAEDDAAIDTFHRNSVQTTWHSMSTCSMKPREKGGVVDDHLNVYGTTNLKVADLSIAPGNVSANTYSTALTIGEKAAVIIAEELGIKGV